MDETSLMPSANPQRESLVMELTQASRLSAANIANILQIPPITPFTSRRTLDTAYHHLTDRHHFFIFVTVLLKYLEKSKEALLRQRVKIIIADRLRAARQGQANSKPLVEVLKRRLCRAVGEWHWARANICYEAFYAKVERECHRRRTVNYARPSTVEAV